MSHDLQIGQKPNFVAIIRACDKVYSMHNLPRPFGLTKIETIKLSLYSLIKSIETVEHRIIVIGDDLSPETIDFIRAFPQITLRQERVMSGQKTLGMQVDMALAESDESWVYLCEDDYLHKRECFAFIQSFIMDRDNVLDTRPSKRNWLPRISGNLKDKALFIHPTDYPDRYLPQRRGPSYLFASKDCHWRQIVNTTHTFMAQAKSLRRFSAGLKASIKGCRDNKLSKTVYGGIFARSRALCVSPMPGLTTHLTDGVMTPFVDWSAEFERNKAAMIQAGLWR
jgi:hypothetical protein